MSVKSDPLAHLRLLTMEQICEFTTYTPQHIYRLERSGQFPVRLRMGGNRVAWLQTEFEVWFANRPRGRPSNKNVDAVPV